MHGFNSWVSNDGVFIWQDLMIFKLRLWTIPLDSYIRTFVQFCIFFLVALFFHFKFIMNIFSLD